MKNRALFVMVCTVILGLQLACTRLGGGVDVEAVFRNAGTLKPGAPVTLNGVNVGRVHAVEAVASGAKVTMRLDAKPATSLREGAAAMLVGAAADRQVELYNPAMETAPIRTGATLTALNNNLEYAAWRGRDMTGSWQETMSEWLPKAQESINEAATAAQSYFENLEWQETQADLEQFMQSLQSKASESARDARTRYEALREDLEPKIREWHEQGKREAAEALGNLMQALESALEEKDE